MSALPAIADPVLAPEAPSNVVSIERARVLQPRPRLTAGGGPGGFVVTDRTVAGLLLVAAGLLLIGLAALTVRALLRDATAALRALGR